MIKDDYRRIHQLRCGRIRGRTTHRTAPGLLKTGKPSILDLVTNTVQKWLLEAISSDSGLTDLQTTKVEAISIQMIKEAKEIRSRLWIHTPHYVALQNFLLIQKGKQLEKIIGAQILNIGSSGCEEEESCKGRGCWSKVEIQNKFSLIDANETSLVGPQLKLITGCGCQPSSVKDANNNTIMNNKDIVSGNAKNAIIQPSSIYKTNTSQVKPKTDTLITNSEHRGHLLPSQEDQHECVYNPCLNGGKCLPTSHGFRCICPFNTFGNRCKILSREFEGSPTI
ncbi:hypothetical protein Avbf_12990 [Armadillidium vulgare]|nr:hypothetical protein Avbf_12990 [Armadillidium vulgare]